MLGRYRTRFSAFLSFSALLFFIYSALSIRPNNLNLDLQLRPDSHRRKWDKDEFEKLARDRLRDEEEDDDTAGPSTSKGGAAANKREHDDDDDEANFDNLVNIFLHSDVQ